MKSDLSIIDRIKRTLHTRGELVSVFSFILVFTVFAIIIEKPWFVNLPTMLRDISWAGIVAIGQAVLMISGEFDLSVGSVYAFVGMIFVRLTQTGIGVVPSFIIALLLAILIGALNGAISLQFKIPSLLVTLGFLFVYRGAVYLMSGGATAKFPDEVRTSKFVEVLGSNPWGFYTVILLFAVLAVILTITLSRTRFGNHLFSVGGDPVTALSCGVSATRIKMFSFMLCSFLAGLAGIIVACYSTGVGVTLGLRLEFVTIAAAVIGGTALSGGIGSVLGAVLGTATLISLQDGLVLSGANVYVYRVLLGPILIIAVAIKEALTRTTK